MKPFYVSLKPYLDYSALKHPSHWEEIFANKNPLEVEIGFGNGEYLARLAQSRKGVNFIGFEEYCQRIHRTLRKLSRVQAEHVRILRMDIRPAFQYLFPPRSISYIHCLYPPPWPKKSDAKHRLFTEEFLRLANNRLIDGGVLKIVTDHFPYILWVQQQLSTSGFQYQLSHIKAGYDTKFERKWVEEGQREFYELLLTKKEHQDIPLKKEEQLKSYQLEHFDPVKFVLKEYSHDGIAVIFRDILYDPLKQTALVHVIVNDEHIFQNIRIVITNIRGRWHLSLAEGTMSMPTQGIAKALELVYHAAEASGKSKVIDS